MHPFRSKAEARRAVAQAGKERQPCTLGSPTFRYASTSGCRALYAAMPLLSQVMRGPMMLAWRCVPTALAPVSSTAALTAASVSAISCFSCASRSRNSCTMACTRTASSGVSWWRMAATMASDKLANSPRWAERTSSIGARSAISIQVSSRGRYRGILSSGASVSEWSYSNTGMRVWYYGVC